MSLQGREQTFIEYLADNFEMVYWVPGNHEYYGYDLGNVADPLLEKIKANVWLVNNQTITFKNINFICSSLWSNIDPVNALDIQRSIADFFEIRWKDKKFTSNEFNQLRQDALSFLKQAVKENAGASNIIVTHHVPTLFQYPVKYANSPLSNAFVTELYDFIYDSQALCWIYGHHHNNPKDFTIGTTRVLTNQLGYVQQNEMIGFRVNAFIET